MSGGFYCLEGETGGGLLGMLLGHVSDEVSAGWCLSFLYVVAPFIEDLLVANPALHPKRHLVLWTLWLHILHLKNVLQVSQLQCRMNRLIIVKLLQLCPCLFEKLFLSLDRIELSIPKAVAYIMDWFKKLKEFFVDLLLLDKREAVSDCTEVLILVENLWLLNFLGNFKLIPYCRQDPLYLIDSFLLDFFYFQQSRLDLQIRSFQFVLNLHSKLIKSESHKLDWVLLLNRWPMVKIDYSGLSCALTENWWDWEQGPYGVLLEIKNVYFGCITIAISCRGEQLFHFLDLKHPALAIFVMYHFLTGEEFCP